MGCVGTPIRAAFANDSIINFVEFQQHPLSCRPPALEVRNFAKGSRSARTQWIVANFPQRHAVGSRDPKLPSWLRSVARMASHVEREHSRLQALAMLVPVAAPCRVKHFIKESRQKNLLPPRWGCRQVTLRNAMHGGPIDTVHEAVICANQTVVSKLWLPDATAIPTPMHPFLDPPGSTRDHFRPKQLQVVNPDVATVVKQSSHTPRLAKLVRTTSHTPRVNDAKHRSFDTFPVFSIQGPAPSFAQIEPSPISNAPFLI